MNNTITQTRSAIGKTMLRAITFLLLIFFQFSPTAKAQTQVYNITPGQLISMPNSCGNSYYGCCGSSGFSWTDVIPSGNNITGVTVTLRVGVECSAGTRTTTLNGAGQPSFTDGGNCACPSLQGTYNITCNPANYTRGGTNNFLIGPVSNSFGLIDIGGVATVTVTYAASSVPATGLNFDGSNDYVTAPSIAALNFGTSTDFTYETWVKLNGSQGDFTGLMVKGGSSGNFTQLVLVGNKIAAEINSSTGFVGVGQGLQGTTNLNDGAWHHVAMVVQRSTNNAKLYVDGNIEANVTNSFISGDVSNAIPFLAGQERNFTVKFNGTMDEIRVWGRAVCQGEMQSHKNCELGTGLANLVLNYHLNTGNTNVSNAGLITATDASPSLNHGTLVNFGLTGTTSNWAVGNASGTCSAFVPSYIITCPGNISVTAASGSCTAVATASSPCFHGNRGYSCWNCEILSSSCTSKCLGCWRRTIAII